MEESNLLSSDEGSEELNLHITDSEWEGHQTNPEDSEKDEKAGDSSPFEVTVSPEEGKQEGQSSEEGTSPFHVSEEDVPTPPSSEDHTPPPPPPTKPKGKRRSFSCPHCQAEVINLPRHLRTVHNVSPQKNVKSVSGYNFRHCPVRGCFATVSRLRIHLKSVHQYTEAATLNRLVRSAKKVASPSPGRSVIPTRREEEANLSSSDSEGPSTSLTRPPPAKKARRARAPSRKPRGSPQEE